jgi:hypothetical protein
MTNASARRYNDLQVSGYLQVSQPPGGTASVAVTDMLFRNRCARKCLQSRTPTRAVIWVPEVGSPSFVNRGDVGEGIANVDDDAEERACGVELHHGTVEDAEGGDVEALKEYLSMCLSVSRRSPRKREGRKTGGRHLHVRHIVQEAATRVVRL